MASSSYITQHYPLGKADLYAAFLLRGLQLVRENGVSAMLTMRGWMFIKQYSELREQLLGDQRLVAIGDVSWGAFREMRDNPVVLSIIQSGGANRKAVAVAPTDPQERVRTQVEFEKKAAGLLCHIGRHDFDPDALKVVPEWPLVYWWSADDVEFYESHKKLGEVCEVKNGVCTGNDIRFTRCAWEVNFNSNLIDKCEWQFLVMGGQGKAWFEPVRNVVRWDNNALQLGTHFYVSKSVRLRDATYYFRRGIAYTTIGSTFAARVHRVPGIFGHMGASLFPTELENTVCMLNSSRAAQILSSLNPSVHFEKGDIDRLPEFTICDAPLIYKRIDTSFSVHEAGNEISIEFRCPRPHHGVTRRPGRKSPLIAPAARRCPSTSKSLTRNRQPIT